MNVVKPFARVAFAIKAIVVIASDAARTASMESAAMSNART
jgi:hypothetical protein